MYYSKNYNSSKLNSEKLNPGGRDCVSSNLSEDVMPAIFLFHFTCSMAIKTFYFAFTTTK